MTARADISSNIHPTALIDAGAELGRNVKVGPFAIISSGVVIGDDVEIMAAAQLLPGVTVGAGCQIFHGAILGGAPQDIQFDGHASTTHIGKEVVVREYATVHRGTSEKGTVVGDGCMLMAYTHIGHDSRLGQKVLLANGVQLGGFAQIDEFAAIGGMTPVHQNCRVGKHAFVGGAYRVVQDVPPYILANGEPLKFGGLNVIGLRRKKIGKEARAAIKEAYRLIYRAGLPLSDAISAIESQLAMSVEIETILQFVRSSGRGLI